MNSSFSISEEYRAPFQRLYPYMPDYLRRDEQALEAMLLCLKLGGEKLVRCAIEAYVQTHRLKTAENQRRIWAESLQTGISENEDADSSEEDTEKDEDEDESEDDDY